MIDENTPDYIVRMNLIETRIDLPPEPLNMRYSGRLRNQGALPEATLPGTP